MDVKVDSQIDTARHCGGYIYLVAGAAPGWWWLAGPCAAWRDQPSPAAAQFLASPSWTLAPVRVSPRPRPHQHEAPDHCSRAPGSRGRRPPAPGYVAYT